MDVFYKCECPRGHIYHHDNRDGCPNIHCPGAAEEEPTTREVLRFVLLELERLERRIETHYHGPIGGRVFPDVKD